MAVRGMTSAQFVPFTCLTVGMQNRMLLILSCAFIFFSCSSPAVSDGRIAIDEPVQDTTRSGDELSFTTAYITGKFDPAFHPDFTEILPEHASASGMLMRKDAYAAFVDMYEAAKKDGVHLKIISATRNFDRQKQIWEKKWTGQTLVEGGVNLAETVPDPVERAKRILRFSSMPGTSRHHWGTDIDLNHLENQWFEQGEGERVYAWLVAHAGSYGFCQPYSPKGPDRPEGYEEEKWHWSWLPVAQPLTRQAEKLLNDSDIQGFAGDQTASTIGVVSNYILGINTICL